MDDHEDREFRLGVVTGFVAGDGKMTYLRQGFATFPWGPPPEDSVRELNAVISQRASEGQFFGRGKHGSRLSELLNAIAMHSISKEKEQYIGSLLPPKSGEEAEREDEGTKTVKLGEPMFFNYEKGTGPPRVYRLGPYGYDKGQALCLLRKVRGTVEFETFSGSQLLDKTQFEQQGPKSSPLELGAEDVVIMDSDLCFNWPLEGSGCFVLISIGRGDQRISIQRDHPAVDVAPFHASENIRRIESQAKTR